MIWFMIAAFVALLAALGTSSLESFGGNMLGNFIVGMLFAALVNLIVAIGWSGTDSTVYKNVSIEQRIINGEVSMDIKTAPVKGREFVVSVDEVNITVGDVNTYIDKRPSKPSKAWTVFPVGNISVRDEVVVTP